MTRIGTVAFVLLSVLTASSQGPASNGLSAVGCGTAYGTLFNMESRTRAYPQKDPSVDFLPNGVRPGVDLVVGVATTERADFGWIRPAGVSYYVSRDSTCAPEIEGSFLGGIETSRGAVAADPARSVIFLMTYGWYIGVDPPGTTYITLTRTFRNTLLNTTACPGGHHSLAQQRSCWRGGRVDVVQKRTDFVEIGAARLAVDERASGNGAGNVYIAYDDFDGIWLAACTNALSACSDPINVSDGDFGTHSPHVAVRPDGTVTVTWVAIASYSPANYPVKYRACTPTSALGFSCGAPRVVYEETQPLTTALLGVQPFAAPTYPSHDHRVDANGTETYVVWARCKVGIQPELGERCADADIVMAASSNGGQTWSAPACVACGFQDQFLPVARSDRARNIINVLYYTSENDAVFQRRVQVFLAQIRPGPATPDAAGEPHILTTLLNDPSGDHRIGLGESAFTGFIGIAARGTGSGASRAYAHYAYNNINALFPGPPTVGLPDQNNHLTRLDY